MQEFLDTLNSAHKYDVLDFLYNTALSKMWMFESSSQNDIMFVAVRMQPILYVAEEEIFYQGDIANNVYIIYKGEVDIFI